MSWQEDCKKCRCHGKNGEDFMERRLYVDVIARMEKVSGKEIVEECRCYGKNREDAMSRIEKIAEECSCHVKNREDVISRTYKKNVDVMSRMAKMSCQEWRRCHGKNI
ncbi:hypothetical protein CEXT_204731 [Caerostris extrusa]|uniref:Uncharacterized protein n=1 Tax=Caerostris extrusa TaxID=172846 RepID=A0AAV4MQJ2_CAEEX|nr:hypothetical protein CEXT_204731 [Caerostris extrusa]